MWRITRAIQRASGEIMAARAEGVPRSSDSFGAFYGDLERRIRFHQEIVDAAVRSRPAVGDEDADESSTNDLVFDIKGTAHLSMFYDNERYQEWRRQPRLHGDKGPQKGAELWHRTMTQLCKSSTARSATASTSI